MTAIALAGAALLSLAAALTAAWRGAGRPAVGLLGLGLLAVVALAAVEAAENRPAPSGMRCTVPVTLPAGRGFVTIGPRCAAVYRRRTDP